MPTLFTKLSTVRLERLAATLWIALVAFVCVRCLVQPRAHSLLPLYATAARNWQIGHDMYAVQPGAADLYRYSPTAAILLIPWSVLPDAVGEVAWRLFNVVVFAGGMVWWCRAVLPIGSSIGRKQWALLFLLAWPLALGSVNNGQINTLMAGLMLATVAAVAVESWNIAAILAALTVLLKVYPLALALVLMAIYPRKFGPRFLGAMLLGLGLPFLCQQGDYVVEQYRIWWQLLAGDDRSHWPRRFAPQDLWLLFRIAHLDVSPPAYFLIRLGLAAGVAAIGLAARLRGCSRRLIATVLSTQVGCWIILCGPNSEACTYIVLAPILAWAALDAWHAERSLAWRGCMLGVALLAVLPHVSRLLTGGQNTAAGFLPVGALILWVYLLATQLPEVAKSARAMVLTPTGPTV